MSEYVSKRFHFWLGFFQFLLPCAWRRYTCVTRGERDGFCTPWTWLGLGGGEGECCDEEGGRERGGDRWGGGVRERERSGRIERRGRIERKREREGAHLTCICTF